MTMVGKTNAAQPAAEAALSRHRFHFVTVRKARERESIICKRVVWLREKDAPAIEVGDLIMVMSAGGAKVVTGGVVESVGCFKDLDPVGHGRRRDDLYVRVKFADEESAFRWRGNRANA